MGLPPEEIISDEQVTRIHGHANFGSMSPRQVLAEGVWKYSMGYTSGYTQMSILLEHGFIRKPKPGQYRSTLTKKGEAYLRATCPRYRHLTLLRRTHDALTRAQTGDITDAEWDALRADVAKQVGD